MIAGLGWLVVGLAAVCIAERAWRYGQVVRFFRRPVPERQRPPRLVSILLPVMSGDPTMPTCLEENLQMQTAFPVEFHWLLDNNDTEAERIAADLMARYPERTVILHRCPPADGRSNPKMVKLVQGYPETRGEVVCVLDDDTVLPDFGLDTCLAYLDKPGVGLAFGLPYYRHFANLWSALVSCFVNGTSLLTYVPYTVLTDPFTVNGMFYAARREMLDAVGGFEGLEGVLSDDFAIGQRFRENGYKLAQTPVRHGIRTYVRDSRHYYGLIRRWFVFPRESLLRHLHGRDLAVLLALGIGANVLPLLALGTLAVFPSLPGLLAVAAMLAHSGYVTTRINRDYLGGATPTRFLPLVLLVQLIFPLQLLGALLTPGQPIRWRDKVMEAERGGTFHYVRRDS
jgi:ceramide glucosyltransferase